MLITRDRQTYPRIQQLQQQLSTVSAAIFPAQVTFFLCTCRSVTIYRSLHLIFAFCVALRSPSVFGLRLSVTSVLSLR